MTDSLPTVPLTDADMDRFHRLAPNALKIRTKGYFLNEFETSFNFLLAGAIPILGVWKWGWSGTNWLVFLVVGCWLGLLLDCMRLHFLNKQVNQYVDGIIDDTFVSVVAEAVRAGEQEFVQAHVPKAPQYRKGIFIDLVFCTISTLVIMASLPENLDAAVFARPWFVPALISFFAYRILMVVWEIVGHLNHPRNKKPVVRLALGIRGASMFIVMFAVLICYDNNKDVQAATDYLVYIINGILIVIGLLNLCGAYLMFSEFRWLRNYMKGRTNG